MTTVAMPARLVESPTTSNFFWALVFTGVVMLAQVFVMLGCLSMAFDDRIPDHLGMWATFGHTLALMPGWMLALGGLVPLVTGYLLLRADCRERTAYLMWHELPVAITEAHPHARREQLRLFVAHADWIGESREDRMKAGHALLLLERACALQDQLLDELKAKSRQRPFACLRPGDHRRIAVQNLLGEVVFTRSGGTYADLLNTVSDPDY
ncbi:MAG TPA: hypothetical protein VHP58_05890 [Alphaproteobacteria bacterium]|nr:hypothetical protein [Alphaproteobacteria bacterium]